MEINEIEYKIACGEMNAAQVFTQMKQHIGAAENKPTKVIANEAIRSIIEDAHMAGQADAGVDPGYSNARAYCDCLFET